MQKKTQNQKIIPFLQPKTCKTKDKFLSPKWKNLEWDIKQ